MKLEYNPDYEKLAEFKNLILILLIVIDLIFIIAISFFKIPDNEIVFMAYFDLIVCILLFINLISEYMKRDCSTADFLKTHIIDIISIIPLNFIFLRYLTVFRIFRILQIIQVVRVINIKNISINSFKYFVQNQLLKTLIFILIIYLVISSIILFTIDSSFLSIFDSFWYGLVTITGVGYGDITPDSYAGKIIGMLSILIGILFVSVFTAATSALYMEKPEMETREAIDNYMIKTKEENEKLKSEIKQIKDETIKLNEKIDELTDMLNKKN